MLVFYSNNLESYPLFLWVKNRLKLFDKDNFLALWNLFIEYSSKMGRSIGNVSFRDKPGNINVLGIRRNPEISFNTNSNFYDDLLVISRNTLDGTAVDFYVYRVTMDPRAKKYKIAHLLLGAYNSYRVRPHRWIPGRTALGQDINPVFIARTDRKGNVLSASPYKGFFGINVHDASKWINSSLGCTVLEKDSLDNGLHFKKSFKPLLEDATNSKDIVYCVTSIKMLNELFYAEVLKKDINDFKERGLWFPTPVSKKASWVNRKFLKPFNVLTTR